MCRVVGGAKQMGGQAECLKDQILADVFGLESGLATKESCSLVLHYDHMDILTRNLKLIYIYYFAPIGYLVPINPRSFQYMATIAFYSNYTKMTIVITDYNYNRQ